MATELFRKVEGGIESCFFPTHRVQANILSGWVADVKDLEEPEEATISPVDNSNKGIRIAAKHHGVADWDSARIATLKEKIGHDN